MHILLGVLSAAVDRDGQTMQFNSLVNLNSTPGLTCLSNVQSGARMESVRLEIFINRLKLKRKKDAFRDLWQLAITEHCRGTERGIEMLPEVVEDIKSSYQDLQVSAVEENFEALSDVI